MFQRFCDILLKSNGPLILINELFKAKLKKTKIYKISTGLRIKINAKAKIKENYRWLFYPFSLWSCKMYYSYNLHLEAPFNLL